MVISELVVAIANLQRPARRKCCQLYVRPPMHLATYLAPATIMHCLLPSDMDTGWNVLDIHRITSRPPKLKRYDPLLIMTSNLAITGLQMEARIPHATRGWSQKDKLVCRRFVVFSVLQRRLDFTVTWYDAVHRRDQSIYKNTIPGVCITLMLTGICVRQT